MRFQVRTVIVTGGAGGIGRVVSSRFAAEGAAVVFADRDEQAAATVAAELGGRAFSMPIDVANAESVRDLFTVIGSMYPAVDVLVNGAAQCSDTPFDRLSEREFDEDMSVT